MGKKNITAAIRKRGNSGALAQMPNAGDRARAAAKATSDVRVTVEVKHSQSLSATESDKAVRIAKVLERASEVLGGADLAKRWLHRRIRSVGGVRPVSLLDTDAGYELVMDTLGRIEHGIVA